MLLFMPIVMFIIWFAVISIIVTVMKTVISGGARQSQPQSRRPAPTVQTRREPQRREPKPLGSFETVFPETKTTATQQEESRATTLHKSFHNSDYDNYEKHRARGRSKDYTTGYDKRYSKGGTGYRQSKSMQYSHTYDGHEPWDDCLPKEKDPWDKDFYVK